MKPSKRTPRKPMTKGAGQTEVQAEFYRDVLFEKISKVMRVFYRAELARANGNNKRADRWSDEVKILLLCLGATMQWPVKGGLDRSNSVRQFLGFIRRIHLAAANLAQQELETSYRMPKLKKPMPASTLDRFIQAIEAAVEDGLSHRTRNKRLEPKR